jgi:hypothetical protein
MRRTPPHRGRQPGAGDCSGVFSIDMNAFASGALGGIPDPALSVAGTIVDVQALGRDQGFARPCNLSLSDAVEYMVCPR